MKPAFIQVTAPAPPHSICPLKFLTLLEQIKALADA